MAQNVSVLQESEGHGGAHVALVQPHRFRPQQVPVVQFCVEGWYNKGGGRREIDVFFSQLPAYQNADFFDSLYNIREQYGPLNLAALLIVAYAP